MEINQTSIRFPEINLSTRDAHKLRGYFGNLFKEHSPLLHNHWEDGSYRYDYPMVQYKVIDNTPLLIGFNNGGKLLTSLFLKIRELKINNVVYPVLSKHIIQKSYKLSVNKDLFTYEFKTLWMGLNQKNHQIYEQLPNNEKTIFLNKLIQNNILSFYKAFNFFVNEKIMVTSKLAEKQTKFKDKVMKAFSGEFTSNALIPEFSGIGKSVSRGFGAVVNN